MANWRDMLFPRRPSRLVAALAFLLAPGPLWAADTQNYSVTVSGTASAEVESALRASSQLVTLAGSRMYTSAADSDEIIDEALNRFEDVFKLV